MEKNEQQKHPERNCKETNITKEMQKTSLIFAWRREKY